MHQIGNLTTNYVRLRDNPTIEDSDLAKVKTRYVQLRDPFLLNDPTADVEFDDFVRIVALAEQE